MGRTTALKKWRSCCQTCIRIMLLLLGIPPKLIFFFCVGPVVKPLAYLKSQILRKEDDDAIAATALGFAPK